MKLTRLTCASLLLFIATSTVSFAELGRGVIKIQNKSPYVVTKVESYPHYYQMTAFTFPDKIQATETGVAFVSFKKCSLWTHCKDDSGIMKYQVQCVVDGKIKTDEIEIHATVADEYDIYTNTPRVYVYQANQKPDCVVAKPNSVSQKFDVIYNENVASISLIPTFLQQL